MAEKHKSANVCREDRFSSCHSAPMGALRIMACTGRGEVPPEKSTIFRLHLKDLENDVVFLIK